MTRLATDTDKYPSPEQPATVTAFHRAVKALVRRRLAEHAGHWPSFFIATQHELITADDLRAIEAEFLKTGYRYDYSSVTSAREAPEKYKPLPESTAGAASPGAASAAVGDAEVGWGDNVTRFAEDRVGTARFVSSSEEVMDLLVNGVPERTIAIIDDSGGTLTAPVLEYFHGIVCMGGTVRSHLGILSREYGIPCLMNATINGVKDGDTLVIESSAAAKTAEAYQKGIEMRARIWKQA